MDGRHTTTLRGSAGAFSRCVHEQFGFPTGLFLVNRWVAKVRGWSYQDYQAALLQFKIHGPASPSAGRSILDGADAFYRDDILQTGKQMRSKHARNRVVGVTAAQSLLIAASKS